jgi:predicted MFS family arabinose efflux permease
LIAAGLFQFVTYACYFNLAPLYPEVGHDLGLDPGELGTLIGIGGIMAVLVQIPAGSGGDRWGRRPFFGLAMVMLALSQLARALAVTPTILLVAQILGGSAQGVATVNAWAAVADVTAATPEKRGQAFGILNANLALGLVAGYILAGGLGNLFGWRTMSLILMLVPLGSLLALGWVGHHTRSPGGGPALSAVLRSITQPQRLALTVMAGLTLAAGQGSLYLLPFAVQQRDLGAFATALLLVPYVVGSVIAGPLGGRVSDRFGTRPVIVATLLIGALAATAMIWVAGASVALVVAMTLIGASVNGALPLLAVRVVAVEDSSAVGVGSILAGLRMGQSTGTFLGPALAGLVLARSGLNAGWLAQAAWLLISLGLHELAAVPRRSAKQPPSVDLERGAAEHRGGV